MDKKLKSVLAKNFIAPPSLGSDKFIDSIAFPKERFINVFISQIKYIRKRVWVLFVLCVGLGFLYTNTAETPVEIISFLSSTLPFFSLCAILEIYKSMPYNMQELESACKYNSSKVTLMRIAILGTVSITTLLIYARIAGGNNFGIFRNVAYIGVPYLLSTYISLFVIAKFPTKETLYISATICGAVSIAMLIATKEYEILYDANFANVWIIAFIVITILVCTHLVKLIKSQEELQCNSL